MIHWPVPSSIEASEHQQEQFAGIANADSRLAILNGGPGTGKTYTTAAIIKAIRSEHGSVNIGLAAPTGKAAIRMTQLMREHKVAAEATTIHRMLGVTRNGFDGGGWGFYYNASNPLPHHVICIDEMSMLGTDLGASLFSAIRPDALVLLIGDTGQLLPVGHGAPMRDMIAAGVPCAKLSEIRRTSGDMAAACKAIAEHGEWRPSTGCDLSAGQNWWHIETRSSAQTLDTIKRLMANLPMRKTTREVQVICTVNGKSDLSRQSLNDSLAPICNQNFAKKGKAWFATDDKVMCTKNSIFTDLEGKADKEGNPATHFVANGEIGYVQKCEAGLCVVKFDDPDRLVEITGEAMKNLTLAYAITTHKSQGSQWPIVIFPIDSSAGAKYLGCRELIYTAISRQQELTITIGQASVAKQMLGKVAIGQRKTFLKEEILE